MWEVLFFHSAFSSHLHFPKMRLWNILAWRMCVSSETRTCAKSQNINNIEKEQCFVFKALVIGEENLVDETIHFFKEGT